MEESTEVRDELVGIPAVACHAPRVGHGGLLLVLLFMTSSAFSAELPEASASLLPRWRGFNLLEKFHKGFSNKPFVEEDFRLISKLGFNFVRLPMDYRVWVKDGDWTQLDESVLREVDKAVAWGKQYGVHVCLNFHRAPGYTVALPKEKLSLWTDGEAQRVCALHWAAFARRYRGVPSRNLSFNLFNEPSDVVPEAYAKVVKQMVEAIHAEDPERLVIADGLGYGRKPVPELAALGTAQSTRGYEPMGLTHYRASWVKGSENMPLPSWPVGRLDPFLYSPSRPELAGPLVLEGTLARETLLRVRVAVVSNRATLRVCADGKEVFTKSFVCGPGEGEWKKPVYATEWKVWQNVYDRDEEVRLPAGTRRVEINLVDGDWLRFGEIGLRPSDGSSPEQVLRATTGEWGHRPPTVRLDSSDATSPFRLPISVDRDILRREMIEPWIVLRRSGVGVHVGEWGVFNKTPHAVVLAWMRDCLENWKEAGMGWALWNFRGSFGVLDSDREDVAYESFEGHRLDRKMLDLLQAY